MKVSDVIDAIEKNGMPKATGRFYGDYVNDDGMYVFTACALGQAARNLGIGASPLLDTLNRIQGKFGDAPFPSQLGDYIAYLNDNTPMSIPEIAQRLRQELNDDVVNMDINITVF